MSAKKPILIASAVFVGALIVVAALWLPGGSAPGEDVAPVAVNRPDAKVQPAEEPEARPPRRDQEHSRETGREARPAQPRRSNTPSAGEKERTPRKPPKKSGGKRRDPQRPSAPPGRIPP